MRIFKRIFLFLVLNIIVVLTVSSILSFLNVKPYLNAYGLDYRALMIFCLIWGMAGALISLALSKKMAKWLMGVKLVDQTNSEEQTLYKMVARLAADAGLETTPEVGIFSSDQPNAFATGPSKKRSLVAVSRGLLSKMTPDEVEAVIGHEISHITNGDMVTMTLIQGVVNAFVMFLARVLAFAISSLGRGDNRNRSSFGSFYILTFVFEILFMILGSMVVALFSRYREYRADQGGAKLAGRDKMVAALKRLGELKPGIKKEPEKLKAMNALMIARPPKMGLLRLFATHPTIEQRIARLSQVNKTSETLTQS